MSSLRFTRRSAAAAAAPLGRAAAAAGHQAGAAAEAGRVRDAAAIVPRDPSPAAVGPLTAAGKKAAAAAKRAATVATKKAAAAAAAEDEDEDVEVLHSEPSPEAIAEQVQRLVAVALAQQSAIAETARANAARQTREAAA